MLSCCAAQATSTENVVIPTASVDRSQVDSVLGGPPTPTPSVMPTRQKTTMQRDVDGGQRGFKEPVTEINCVFEKAGTTGLGLDIAFEGRRGAVDTLFVERVHANGLAQDYNDSVGPESQICAGDYIVVVNNVMGAGMTERLKKDMTLDIVFMKTHELHLKIPKDGTLGMEIAYKDDKDYLFVKSIGDGSVARYNMKVNPAKKLKTPARIVAVNGFRGKATQLFVKLSTSKDPLEITVSQPTGVRAEIWEA